MAKTLMKGNHAIAEAAIRYGCTFFAGYPITPQSEIPEYLSWRMEQAGGTFVQTESELAGISMVYGAACCGARAMTSSSGPGFSLMQEGISYMASAEVPAVIVNMTRYGCGLGAVSPAQGDYLQMAKNGGHGDYRCIVLAPGSVQEAVDAMGEAFTLAEKYRNPVLVACDGAIGQMVEAVDFPAQQYHDTMKFDWALKGYKEGCSKMMGSKNYPNFLGDRYDGYMQEKFGEIEAREQRYECVEIEDADMVLVAYGTTARIVKDAVKKARKQGLKLGLIRPKTLWPFPAEAFRTCKPQGFLAIEMCTLPQMAEDVALAARDVAPAYSYLTGGKFATEEEIIEAAQKALAGECKEV